MLWTLHRNLVYKSNNLKLLTMKTLLEEPVYDSCTEVPGSSLLPWYLKTWVTSLSELSLPEEMTAFISCLLRIISVLFLKSDAHWMQNVMLHLAYLTAYLWASSSYCAWVSSSLSPKLSRPSSLVAELPAHAAVLPARWVTALLCAQQNHILSRDC